MEVSSLRCSRYSSCRIALAYAAYTQKRPTGCFCVYAALRERLQISYPEVYSSNDKADEGKGDGQLHVL